MDTVATLSLNDFKNQTTGTSAADLFKSYMKEDNTEVASENQPITEKTEKTAAQLFEESSKSQEEGKEGETDTEAPKEEAPKVAELETKSKGRPSEKLSEQTKADILALIEEGKLDGFDDGKYETKKDLQDLLDANREKWETESYTRVKGEFLNSLNPGMQFVAKYAENVTHPSELIPFLTAIDNHSYVQELDPENVSHQEQIIREVNAIKGIPDAETEDDIADLKDRNKLADRAKALKPQLDNYTKQQIIALQQQQALQLQQEQEFWINRKKELKTTLLDAPQVDGLKLKQEHKELAMVALSEKTKSGDLYIYSIIDNLLEKKDFETLAQIAILGMDKKAYKNYIQSQQKAEDAQATIRALKTRDKGTNTSLSSQSEEAPASGTLKRPVINSLGSLPRR